ncbi:unnamed protein product [Adineta steineri]|uniref:Uncharacterized protein n=1 Tax=Adineta steineri TaxID=433720 RepID=A0A814KQK2_9BILA|nr:unnamed protein product [Adineta steineri]CAF1623989.1 unnamed protein product [Adineta steineri]
MSYYQAIKITVLTTGVYAIRCSSTIDTYGYMYNSTFNPVDPNQNLLSSDDDSGGNDQFMLANILQPMTKYILIVTTYAKSVTGRFTLIGKGPDSISYSLVNSSTMQSSYSSSLTKNSQVYTRPNASIGSIYYCQAFAVNISTTGIYAIFSDSTMDTIGYIYNSTFNPAGPNQNLLLSNDDSGGNDQFMFSTTFQVMMKYILVVTTYISVTTGKFSLYGLGGSLISFVPFNIINNVSKVASNYSSTLITNSSRFCRTGNCSASIYYYQAIQLNVSTTGTYTILCSSTMNTYGYLYNNTFNSSSLSLNQFASDDDSGGNNQFMFLILLQAVGKYILIVTTYKQNVTGSFSIISTGAGTVRYVKL